MNRNRQWAADTLKKAAEILDAMRPLYRDGKFPGPSSVGGVYPPIENDDWTTSFYTGMFFLQYECGAGDGFLREAYGQCLSFVERMKNRVSIDTHDLGFLYILSCVAGLRFFPEDAPLKKAALDAAAHLATRYIPAAGVLQAWGDMNDPNQSGRIIIDCLMNLPLLFWADKLRPEAGYARMALSHMDKTLNYIVRADDSSYHTYYFDPLTGQARYGRTAQGAGDGSCWSRGQAWGIYGFALGARNSGLMRYADASRRLCDYYLKRLPEDMVPYWDLSLTDPAEERDSSAAAIAACGMMELAGLLGPAGAPYLDAALKTVTSLAENYMNARHGRDNGILLHGVYSKPDNRGVDESCIWGDYFFTEALARTYMAWTPYWVVRRDA